MNNFEFLGFLATPNEKHLGIASVKCYGKIVLKYKIIRQKDSTHIFPAPASYKLVVDGADKYVPAFLLDSMSDKEILDDLIIRNVKSSLAPSAHVAPKVVAPVVDDFPF